MTVWISKKSPLPVPALNFFTLEYMFTVYQVHTPGYADGTVTAESYTIGV